MATNQVYGPNRTRSLPVTADTASGSPVVVGSLVGVALTDEGDGGNDDGNATVALDGAFNLPVGTTTAGAVGSGVYITSAYALTPSATGNTLFGYLLEAKGTTAGEVHPIEIAQV